MTAAKERYRILLRGDSVGDPGELARLAGTLGRRTEARGWALIRDGKATGRASRARAARPSGPDGLMRGRDTRRARSPTSASQARPAAILGRSAGGRAAFVDDAEAAGLRFVHDNGQTPRNCSPRR